MNKSNCIAYFLLAFMSVFVLGISILYNNHRYSTDRELNLSILDNPNMAIQEQEIEKSDLAIGYVEEFVTPNHIRIVYPNYPEVNILVCLSTEDIIKLQIGDIVTVSGRIRYICSNRIEIGSSPYHNKGASFCAKLVSVSYADSGTKNVINATV